ncbi:DUF6262 family protein [Clostridium butyricum]|uniref:DUF6262 family protein n=1 Tax=Clostridium butyricum TaxID=1492 RepID=UPI0034672541
MRELPNEIRDFQEKSKTTTIDKVQTAINDLQAEGFIVTRKLLLERTGLSNSVLSKPHIKDVLKENRVCQYAVKRKIKAEGNADILLELNKSNKKIESLEEKVKDLENKLNKEKVAYYEMKEDNEILRGKLHLLKQKAKLKGIVLE